MIKILYEDESILVCVKPSGTLSELSDSENSLPRILCQELNLNTLYTVHRLDREVGGVMLYAKTADVAKTLSNDVAERKIKKEYLTIIEGKPNKESDTLVDLLFKDSSRNKSYVVKRERKGVKKASLYYETLASRGDTALVHIELHTGRTHQIRVQFSSRGHAVLGDRKYGSSVKDNSIALCSYRLSFSHPKTKRSLCFSHIPSSEGLWGTYNDVLVRIEEEK